MEADLDKLDSPRSFSGPFPTTNRPSLKTAKLSHSELLTGGRPAYPTVPRRLAKITAVMAGVRVVEAPREIKSFPYFMAWHPRLTKETAHKWFREQLRSAVRTG
jgi:DNA-binding transcriptional LysR family regulator